MGPQACPGGLWGRGGAREMAGWTLNPLSAQGSEAGGAAADLECSEQCRCGACPAPACNGFAQWASVSRLPSGAVLPPQVSEAGREQPAPPVGFRPVPSSGMKLVSPFSIPAQRVPQTQ